MTDFKDLKERTKEFAYFCIKVCVKIEKGSDLANIVTKQLIRSSTSIAANYRAAYISPTRKAFGAKLSICAEEADEAAFWLQVICDHQLLLKHSNITPCQISGLISEADQLTRIFIASRKTVAKDPPY